jgi:hypothetical protein
MNDHMEFRSKYIRDAQGIRIIEYETDEKVKKLIVQYNQYYRIVDFFMFVVEIIILDH